MRDSYNHAFPKPHQLRADHIWWRLDFGSKSGEAFMAEGCSQTVP